MHPSRLRVSPAALLCCLLGACSPSLEVPAGARVSCATSSDCPSGFTCRAALGQCVAADNGDATAPALAGEPAVSPGVVRRDGRVTVTFDVTEALGAAPTVRADVGADGLRPLTLAAGSDPAAHHYVFEYTAAGDEPRPAGRFEADLVDLAGNRSTQPLGSVGFDFAAPAVANSSVSLVPGPANPLPQVVAAGPGTAVVVTVVPTEPLAAAPAPALDVQGPGGVKLAFALDPASSDRVAIFRATVPGGQADGEYGATLTWADAVGNSAAVALPTTFTVRTSAPVLGVDQAAVRFVRSPWGAAADEHLGSFTVPAGPFFGLAPADALSTAAALPATAFTFPAGRPLVKLRVWASPGKTTLLGDLAPVAAGWERKALDPRDTEFAWVTGLDDAGNESAPVQVKAAEWIATAHPPAFGRAVHEVTATSAVAPSLGQAPVGMTAAELAAVPGKLAAPDDDGTAADRSLAVASSPRWLASPAGANAFPSGRGGAAMAWDPARRRLVLFGGSAVPGSSADALDDTWEWDGRGWTKAQPAGASPPRRAGSALWFDPARGTIVLFGGSGQFCLEDLWEWDGVRWSPLAAAGDGPLNCGRGAAAWDAGRGKLAYWDGENAALWFFDGKAWARDGATGGPQVRLMFPAMAYDAVRKTLVLYGGLDDGSATTASTWEWDGAWHLVKAVSAPGARAYAATAWDPVRGKVVLVGGTTAGNTASSDVWTWSGADWVAAATAGTAPAGRGQAALAWDDATGTLVLAGGVGTFSNLVPADTWRLFPAGRWLKVPATQPLPTQRKHHAMAADAAGGGALLFGGVKNNNVLNAGDVLADTWRYAGGTWSDVSTLPAPTARVGHAMAPTPSGAMLFGGMGPGGAPVYQNDLWAWTGASWADVSPASGRPSARTGAGLAYDRARGKLVLFGGSNGAALGDVWEYAAGAWSNRTPGAGAASPGPRAYHAMAYDEDLARVVVFGGCDLPQDVFGRCNDAANAYGDVWAWDGAAWTELAPDLGVTARATFGLAWAPVQHRTLLFGGYDGHTTYALPMEFDGSGWWPSDSGTGAPAALGNAVGLDPTSGRPVTFGGVSATISQESWEWDAPPDRQPAVQLTVSTAPAAIDPATVEAVRVRASCGGFFAPFDAPATGAALWGWSRAAGTLGTGGWTKLGASTSGFTAAGALAAPASSRIDWTSGSAAEASRFLLTGRELAAFQCRPAGPAVDPAKRGVAPVNGAGEAVVAADYLEVRVRYRAP
ncbi:MAG: hypothetical protein QM704_05895 [Anaeromyxobacteraceae bacterium]